MNECDVKMNKKGVQLLYVILLLIFFFGHTIVDTTTNVNMNGLKCIHDDKLLLIYFDAKSFANG